MWRRVALARIDVSEERIASIVWVTTIGELGTANEEWRLLGCGSCKNRRFGGTQRASFIRVTNGEIGTTLAVTSNRGTLLRNTKRASVARYS
jgi:hypothetical protein